MEDGINVTLSLSQKRLTIFLESWKFNMSKKFKRKFESCEMLVILGRSILVALHFSIICLHLLLFGIIWNV